MTAYTAPINVIAARGNASAIVTWDPTTNPVGTQFIVKWNNGASSQPSVSSTLATITGLTNGQSYTFTVVANDQYSSTASNTVTPLPFYTFTCPLFSKVTLPDGNVGIKRPTSSSTYSKTYVKLL